MMVPMARRPLLHRIGRVLIGVVAMAAVVALAGALLWRQAPEWGIPYASFTNERGSECENTWSGFRCDPMTLTDLDVRTGITFPEGTEIDRAVYTETHNFAVQARVIIPRGEGKQIEKQLRAEFGPCQDVGRNPLTSEASRRCLRSSDGVRGDGGELPPNVWQVASAVPDDLAKLVVDVDLRSR